MAAIGINKSRRFKMALHDPEQEEKLMKMQWITYAFMDTFTAEEHSGVIGYIEIAGPMFAYDVLHRLKHCGIEGFVAVTEAEDDNVNGDEGSVTRVWGKPMRRHFKKKTTLKRNDCEVVE